MIKLTNRYMYGLPRNTSCYFKFLFFEQTFLGEIPYRKLATMFFSVPVDVLAGFKSISSVPILALKGSIQHIQKGHLILVTQGDASRLMRVQNLYSLFFIKFLFFTK